MQLERLVTVSSEHQLRFLNLTVHWSCNRDNSGPENRLHDADVAGYRVG